jgi:pSer/pThr/pTyr-binding forkhead associated (FHA) protein
MLRKLSVRLREAERRIETLDISGEARAAAKLQPVTRPRAATAPPGNGTRLVVEGDEENGFALGSGETMVGRFDPVTEMRPDIDLTQLDLKRSVSRRHGRIFPTDDGFAITEEVGALNGTFVNGEKLVTGRPHPIRDGDQISFGMVKLVFRV